MSSIPAVKAKLVSLLTTALPNTQVIYGGTGTVTTTGPRILLIGRASGTRQPDSMSLDTSSEQYVIELVASVDLAGTSQQAADEMALDDYAAAELAIREYSGGGDLGLAASGVLSALPTGAFDLEEQADENGRHAAVRFGVAVIAQNT